MPPSLQSQITPLNRLSEQEEEDDDGDGDYDDDVEEGCEDDVVDNVSKHATSSTFSCNSAPGDSKVNSYSFANDRTTIPTDSLRKRINAASSKTKTTKSKCVQFMPSPKRTIYESSSHSTIYSTAELNAPSKPLKKIIFNGTFPIDDPYSSRF